MSQFFYIHPENPQQRLINQAVEIVRKGGVIVYPTDSGYALGCKIEDKGAMERICRIRHLPVLRESRLAGVISIGDVVKCQIAEATNEAESLRTYISAG